jgi:hypothetical protein
MTAEDLVAMGFELPANLRKDKPQQPGTTVAPKTNAFVCDSPDE